MTLITLLLACLLSWSAPDLPRQERSVFVTASFLGKNRLFLENLSREEIRVFENGLLRQVEFFAGSEVPAAYALIFDRAILPEPFDVARPSPNGIPSSMAATNVAYQLVDQGLKGQVGWVATYDNEMRIALDFSQDEGRVKDVVQRLRGQRTLEESSLYASLFAAVKKMSERNEKRRVLVLFLDTLDMETGGKLKPLKNLLSASNVELFVASFASSRLGTGHGLPPAQSEASLRELAGTTAGGAYFSMTEGIEGLGRRIANQIRTFYTIGFQSDATSDHPASLKVECTIPGTKVTTHPVVPTFR